MSVSFPAYSTITVGTSEALSSLSLVRDETLLVDGARLYGNSAMSVRDTEFTTPQLFFGPRDALSYTEGNEYTLTFNAAVGKSNPSILGKMEVYLSGSAFPVSDPLGYKIATLECARGAQGNVFSGVSENIVALRTGTAKLRFVVYSGQWHTSNVSITAATEFGFNPDETDVLVPITGIRRERVKFDVELYDANNNLFPVPVESSQIQFDGGNLVVGGVDNVVSGSIRVTSQEGTGIALTTEGYTDASGIFVPGVPAIYVGSGRYKHSNTPFIVAGKSGSTPIFSLGDRLYAEQSGSTYAVTVSGTLLVEPAGNGTGFVDVRDYIRTLSTATGSVTTIYVQEVVTQSMVTTDAHLNYSASVLNARADAIIISTSQSIFSASVVDSVNRIRLSTSAKTQPGLYLESASMGFWQPHVSGTGNSNANYPVVINSDGQFRIASSGSWAGTVASGSFQEMIGMSNGAFLIKTKRLLLDTPGMQLAGIYESGSTVGNFMKMGANASSISLTNGAGVYMDGIGNFRAGTDVTGSEFIRLDALAPTSLQIKTSNLYFNAQSASAGLTLSQNEIMLGNPQPTTFLGGGPGVYFNRQGQFFIGSGSLNPTNVYNSTGSFLAFGGQTLVIKTSQFSLAAGGLLVDSTLNNGNIVLGGATTYGAGQGVYMDGNGNFRAGSPLTQYISWDGSALTIRGNVYIGSTGMPLAELGSSNITQLMINPEFQTGDYSNWAVYDNSSTGNIALSMVTSSTAPNSTGRVLRLTVSSPTGINPGIGGVYNMLVPDVGIWPGRGYYHRNTTILFKIKAKFPVGFTLEHAHNGWGSDGSTTWITSQAGTGDWATYVLRVKVGTVGSLGSNGHWYLINNSYAGSYPLTWDIASVEANCIDMPETTDALSARQNIGNAPNNLIQNGGGQLDTPGIAASGWTYSFGLPLVTIGTDAKFGDRCLGTVHSSATQSFSYQTYAANDGDVIEVTGWIKTPTGLVGGPSVIYNSILSGVTSLTLLESSAPYSDGWVVGIPAGVGTIDWTYVRTVFRVNGTGLLYTGCLHGYSTPSTGTAYWDGITIRKMDRYTTDAATLTNNNLDTDGVKSSIKGFNLPTDTPSTTGLHMNSQYMGYWNNSGGTWNSFISASGAFRFYQNDANQIYFNGSQFIVRTTDLLISSSNFYVDSTLKRFSAGGATSYTVGDGLWIDAIAQEYRMGGAASTGGYVRVSTAGVTISADANNYVAFTRGGGFSMVGSGSSAVSVKNSAGYGVTLSSNGNFSAIGSNGGVIANVSADPLTVGYLGGVLNAWSLRVTNGIYADRIRSTIIYTDAGFTVRQYADLIGTGVAIATPDLLSVNSSGILTTTLSRLTVNSSLGSIPGGSPVGSITVYIDSPGGGDTTSATAYRIALY